jgi:hypothetical protein
MYTREEAKTLFRLVESGKYALTAKTSVYNLADFWSGVEAAAQRRGWQEAVVLKT